MKIILDIEGVSIPATLENTEAARDFASLLPLTITLKDYASTEKISDLPRKLSVNGAPAGVTPVAGDITYYAPWGNLALFYKNFSYSAGLVRLGKMDSTPEVLTRPGPLKATLRCVQGCQGAPGKSS